MGTHRAKPLPMNVQSGLLGLAMTLSVVACVEGDDGLGTAVGNATQAASCTDADQHGDTQTEATPLPDFSETAAPVAIEDGVGEGDDDWYRMRITEIFPAEFRPELLLRTEGPISDYQLCLYYPERALQFTSPCDVGEQGPSAQYEGEKYGSCCGVPIESQDDVLVMRFDADVPLIDDDQEVFLEVRGPEATCGSYELGVFAGYFSRPDDWPQF